MRALLAAVVSIGLLIAGSGVYSLIPKPLSPSHINAAPTKPHNTDSEHLAHTQPPPPVPAYRTHFLN